MGPSLLPPTCARPPRLPATLVPRPRAYARLDEGKAALLTLVVAPAGFGKTTLLADWAARRNEPVAWLSLDDGDADPDVLWTGVLAALAVAFPTLDAGVEPAPAEVAVLAGLAPPGALVLDGYERLPAGGPADESLWRFARERPLSLQLVVAGRREPSLPLAAARARGELVELRARELAFTDAEARRLVRAVDGARRRDVDEIVARCDGWAAALRLALDPASEPHWEARVRELVLDVLSGRDEERAFLVETSVLDELTAPLCDAVLARQGSETMLAGLERDGLFVERVVGTGRCRVHAAARRVLRGELDRTDPRLVPELHRRAAAWYRGAREPAGEIEHLIACGDVLGAGRRLARSWTGIADAGGRPMLLDRLEGLPPVPTDVRLALARGWLLRLDGRRTESDAWLDAARRAAPPRARPAVVRACVLARAVLLWDDVGHGLALARRAWRSERQGPRRPLAAWALGWASWWSGDSGTAADALADALDGPVLVGVAARSVLARIELERGEVDRAEELVRDAAAAAETRGLDGLHELGMLATAQGLVAAARGEGGTALDALRRGVRLRRSWGHPLETADALVAAASVAAALEGRPAAAELLLEARRLTATCLDPGVLPARLDAARRAALPRPDAPHVGEELTGRERTVLRLLAEGRSKREIAQELYVSFNTVHSHTKAIYRKLGVSSRDEAVERMRELNLY